MARATGSPRKVTPKAGAGASASAYSHKKAYADWIGSARRPETRGRRVAQAVEMIASGRKLN